MSELATFQYYSLSERVLDLFKKTRAKEIHDKIIISTAKLVKADALITKDEELKKLEEVKVIWS